MVEDIKRLESDSKHTSRKEVLLLYPKAALISGQSNPKGLCRLFNEVSKGSINFTLNFYEDLVYELSMNGSRIAEMPSNKDLADYDLVYQRKWRATPAPAASVATYLRSKNVPFIDQESYYHGSFNKLTQYSRMWALGLPFPKTVFASQKKLKNWIKTQLADTFTFPVIMKGVAAHRGEDNHLINSVSEAVDLVAKAPDIDFLIQEFIPNDGDYRIIVGGDEVLFVMHRQSPKGTHVSNAKGGKAVIVNKNVLSTAMLNAAIQAAKSLQRDIAGVDLVIDNSNGSFYILEVNPAPQIVDSPHEKEKAIALQDYFTKLMDRKAASEER